MLLVFFLLVGVVSSLGKVFTDYLRKKQAIAAAERLRSRNAEKSGQRGTADEEGSRRPGLRALFGLPATEEEPGGPFDDPRSEPIFLDDRAEEEEVPGSVFAGERGYKSLTESLGERVDTGIRGPAQADFAPMEAGVPLAQAPAMTTGSSTGRPPRMKFKIAGTDRRSMRQAFVMSEVLAPPLALR